MALSDDLNVVISQLRGAKVLLVEESDINGQKIRPLLEQHGVKVKSANTGWDAMSLLSEDYFDGVLMDCKLPHMDGLATTRKIREFVYMREVPIIALADKTNQDEREQIYESGMKDLIEKPVDVDAMFSTMAKWISPSN